MRVYIDIISFALLDINKVYALYIVFISENVLTFALSPKNRFLKTRFGPETQHKFLLNLIREKIQQILTREYLGLTHFCKFLHDLSAGLLVLAPRWILFVGGQQSY